MKIQMTGMVGVPGDLATVIERLQVNPTTSPCPEGLGSTSI